MAQTADFGAASSPAAVPWLILLVARQAGVTCTRTEERRRGTRRPTLTMIKAHMAEPEPKALPVSLPSSAREDYGTGRSGQEIKAAPLKYYVLGKPGQTCSGFWGTGRSRLSRSCSGEIRPRGLCHPGLVCSALLPHLGVTDSWGRCITLKRSLGAPLSVGQVPDPPLSWGGSSQTFPNPLVPSRGSYTVPMARALP